MATAHPFPAFAASAKPRSIAVAFRRVGKLLRAVALLAADLNLELILRETVELEREVGHHRRAAAVANLGVQAGLFVDFSVHFVADGLIGRNK